MRILTNGYPGTYWQPPEAAELEDECEFCGREVLMLTSDRLEPGARILVTCAECGAEDERFVPEPDEDWGTDR